MDARGIRTAVVDLDRTAASRAFIDRLGSGDAFRVVARHDTPAAIAGALDRGEASCGIVIGRGFMERLETGGGAPVQAIHDGTDANRASLAQNYLTVIAGRLSRETLETRRRVRGSQTTPRGVAAIEVESRAWFNEELESSHFFVPGVIGSILTLVTLMLTSMAIVREKEIGTLEQLLVSPIRPFEIILGKTIPFLLVGFVHAGLVIAVAVGWFGVPLRGSFALLFAGMILYICTCLGLGILISTFSATQQQAMLLTSLVFIPSLLLSGFIFPIANMPPPVRLATRLVPLRYFLVIVRGIFLKGIGFSILWREFAAIAVLGAAIVALAVSRFRKTID